MNDRNSLPVRGNLVEIYASTGFIVILVAVAVGIGILYRNSVYPSPELIQAFFPSDVAILIIGLPMLLGSMWLTWRDKLYGLLLWPGALLFVLYNYLIYLMGMPFSWMYLVYLLLVAISTYTLIKLVADIDGGEVKQRLTGAVGERLAGGVLAVLGSLFFLRVLGIVIGALTSQTLLGETELALNSTDFLITPVWVIGGVSLWRKKRFGYVTGLGLLFQGCTLFIGLIILLIIQPLLTDGPVPWSDIIIVFVMSFVSFIPLALFIRGVASRTYLPE